MKLFPLQLKWAMTLMLTVVLLTHPTLTAPVMAALPNLLNITQKDKTLSDSEQKKVSPEQQRETTKLALTKAQDERSLAKPPESSRNELNEKFRLLDGLVTRINSQLNLIDEREELRRSHTVIEQKVKGWTGFTNPPPYPILMVDEIMASVLTARATARSLTTNQELLAQQVAHYGEAAKQSREMERKATDEFERAGTAEERSAALLNKELTGLRTRNADAMAVLIALRYEVLGEKCGIAGVELELLERQLAQARKSVVFGRSELDRALERLKVALQALEQELDTSLVLDTRRRSTLSQTQQALDSFLLRDNKTDSSALIVTQRGVLELRNRAALAWVESSRFEGEVVAALIAMNKSNAALWGKRFTAVTGTDAEKRRTIIAEFRKSRESLKPWLEFTTHQLEMSQAAEHEQESHLAKIVEGSPVRKAESDLLAAKRLQRELAERYKSAIEQADIERQAWLEDMERVRQSRSISDRSRDWLKAFPTVFRSVWRFELFSIEDSVEVAGQKVVTSRGVTVGKSFGALILFLFGYFIAAFIGRRVQQIMITRFDISAHQANVIRRWLMALTIFTLLIITLNLARIPLTVFAFLGGALAIGVGFGTQTIIKNFISGILILLERNMKVGDTVDVDGVVGRIATVDMRASTILGFDGVETVIPNSTFLENKVTNWTHTNARLRRIVRVGVAYGSQTTRVRDILTECGNAHHLILKDPPPEAFFDDFGDNSLVFALYFWIDYGPEVNPLQVASDLRFMMDQRFADEKIVLAFPQRDVHLDSAQPLRIEMVTAAVEGTV
jgi:small-conductance mechanosensitive channel